MLNNCMFFCFKLFVFFALGSSGSFHPLIEVRFYSDASVKFRIVAPFASACQLNCLSLVQSLNDFKVGATTMSIGKHVPALEV